MWSCCRIHYLLLLERLVEPSTVSRGAGVHVVMLSCLYLLLLERLVEPRAVSVSTESLVLQHSPCDNCAGLHVVSRNQRRMHNSRRQRCTHISYIFYTYPVANVRDALISSLFSLEPLPSCLAVPFCCHCAPTMLHSHVTGSSYCIGYDHS